MTLRTASPRPRRRPYQRPACCRTWHTEHLLPDGTPVRTTWHQPACQARPAR
ncbi:hypothetical protein AB0C76_30885 [Kitasatospora sp. NPDC048722]|uniref:hypothetical protein n=1 Tax=Kitasatospora sp. NPDC048722 TaxID=3155639 RepID=UPI0033F58277